MSRDYASRNHFPAIDINASVSRLMNDIVSEEHKQAASKIRNMLALYYQNFDLITIGAYKQGLNPKLDEAVNKIDKINSFLKQGINEFSSFENTLKLMEDI